MRPWHLFVLFLIVRLMWISLAHYPTIMPDELVYLSGNDSLYYHALAGIGYHQLLVLNAIIASLAVFPVWWLAEKALPEHLIPPATATILLFPMFWAYTGDVMVEPLFSTCAMFFFWAAYTGKYLKVAAACFALTKSLFLPFALAAIMPGFIPYFGAVALIGLVELWRDGIGLSLSAWDMGLNLLKSAIYLAFAPGFGLGVLGLMNLKRLPSRASWAVLGLILAATLAVLFVPPAYYVGRYYDSVLPILALLGMLAVIRGDELPKWVPFLAIIAMLGAWAGLFEYSSMDAGMMYLQFGLFLPVLLIKNTEHRAMAFLLLPALMTILVLASWLGMQAALSQGCGMDADFCDSFKEALALIAGQAPMPQT